MEVVTNLEEKFHKTLGPAMGPASMDKLGGPDVMCAVCGFPFRFSFLMFIGNKTENSFSSSMLPD